jgi:hypothetical protein
LYYQPVLALCYLGPSSYALPFLEILLLLKALKDTVHGKEAEGKAGGEYTDVKDDSHLVVFNAAPTYPLAVTVTNALKATEFESDHATGSYVFLHKPTRDPVRLAAGDYPYASHMHGRRRLWEFRLQMTCKETVTGDVFFGCEQDRYYPIGMIESYLSQSVTSMLRRCSAGMYQTHGDDPARSTGELERPCNVFPLWVIDQIVITPEGERVPDLRDPQFATLGMTKSDDRQAMKTTMKNLILAPGSTYTFSFWCVAQCVDAIGWKVAGQGLVPEQGLRPLGTHPPCYITMYSMKKREDWPTSKGKTDYRHLDSRKNYLMRVGFWSSEDPVEGARAKELTCSRENNESMGLGLDEQEKASRFCCGF